MVLFKHFSINAIFSIGIFPNFHILRFGLIKEAELHKEEPFEISLK